MIMTSSSPPQPSPNNATSPTSRPFIAPTLSFSLSDREGSGTSAAHSTRARLGTLIFKRELEGYSWSLPTPAIINYTRNGCPVHLTNDNVDRLPIDMVAVATEQLLDYQPPPYLSAPFPFARYLGLRDRPAPTARHGDGLAPKEPAEQTKRDPHVVLGMLRDPSDLEMPVSNHDTHVACQTFRGVRKITPAIFLAYSLPRPPDMLIALADEPTGAKHSHRRIGKSLTRSAKWLQTVVEGSKDVTNVIAPLVGSANAHARKEYATSMSDRADDGSSLASRVAGFSINLNGLRKPEDALAASEAEAADLSKLIQASLVSLPPGKPRIALCPQGPHELLRLVDEGIDMFVDEWSSMLSSTGIALDFAFPPAPEGGQTGRPLPLGINLFHEDFAGDFTPLASPALHAALLQQYGAESLGDAPTRGYVHHLLHTHEMTSHVLLAMHNTCVMALFLSSVRASLAAGGFDADKRAFEAMYEERLSCLEEARREWAKVAQERGKGRLRGLGQGRRDGDDSPAGATLAEQGTPDNELERMSVIDPVDGAGMIQQ